MSLNNSFSRYGSVAKTFHWLTVLLILTTLPLGIIANGAPFTNGEEVALKAWLFSMHKTLGITTFFVALARILWAFTQPRPGLLNAENRPEAALAEAVHWLLYGSLVLVPLSGWIHHASTTGFAPIWWPFGQSLPFVPKSESLAELTSGLHIVFERVLIISIFLHVAGAVKHHVIDRDQTLRRMLPGKNTAPTPPSQHHSFLPLAIALCIWAAALGVGTYLGVFGHAKNDHATAPAAELSSVTSDWAVQDHSLSIVVRQFGAETSGSFADLTAAITFDETLTDGTYGTVETTVSIASLTLGSVTDQALGVDFFDANTFPTARFVADIIPGATDAYIASGTLTIRDTTVPVELPFTLVLDGDSAQMQGSMSLDRRTFGIGDNMADESSLGFAVTLNVTLTATRN
jgi:cytochrome b561/polyisoprenoid-binding protein YceI